MQKNKELVNDLNYDGIKLPVLEMILVKLKRKTTFASMLFVMKISLPFQFTFLIKNLKIQLICCF